MSYAANTTVSVDKTRAEIEALLRKSGATGIFGGWDSESRQGQIVCRLHERMIRFKIALPSVQDFMKTESGRNRSPAMAKAAMAQEERRKWRALLLIIKAKLEMIASGDSTIEREFLADLMLPDGSTFYEHTQEHIALAYATGQMPKLLLGKGA